MMRVEPRIEPTSSVGPINSGDGDRPGVMQNSFEAVQVNTEASAQSSLIEQGAVDSAPPPTVLPFGRYSDWVLGVLLLIMMRVLYTKHRSRVLKCIMCVLEVVAVCGPLKSPALAVIESMQYSRRPTEEPEIESGLVAASSEDEEDDSHEIKLKPAAKVKHVQPKPRAKSSRKKHGSRVSQELIVVKEKEEDIEEGRADAQAHKEVEEINDEVEEIKDDEVEEIDDYDGQGDDDRDQARRVEAAVKARLDQLEAKIAQGEQLTLGDIAGTRARVSETGEFVTAPSARMEKVHDDSFTMVGLPTQASQTAEPRASAKASAASRAHEARQVKLEEALRQKQERLAKQVAAETEQLKRKARRELRSELLHMDHELDALLAGQASKGAPPSQLLAAKWLVEYAYTKYPPPYFSKRRASEEARMASELRFRDATITALKVLQVRYGPAKNSAADYGAEWAVIAEEVTKHAFSLTQGISRSSKQESMPSTLGLTLPTTSGMQDDDGIHFSLSSHVEDVEDAD